MEEKKIFKPKKKNIDKLNKFIDKSKEFKTAISRFSKIIKE
jgi:vacuolar-type H+-ATPase subunit H